MLVPVEEYVDSLALFVTRLRESRGFTVSELANRLGHPVSLVEAIESGECVQLGSRERRALSRALSVDVRRLAVREMSSPSSRAVLQKQERHR